MKRQATLYRQYFRNLNLQINYLTKGLEHCAKRVWFNSIENCTRALSTEYSLWLLYLGTSVSNVSRHLLRFDLFNYERCGHARLLFRAFGVWLWGSRVLSQCIYLHSVHGRPYPTRKRPSPVSKVLVASSIWERMTVTNVMTVTTLLLIPHCILCLLMNPIHRIV